MWNSIISVPDIFIYFSYHKRIFKTLFHLNAHPINRLLRQTRKSIPNLNGKKLLKNIIIQTLNYISVSKLIKVNHKCSETKHTINIGPYGENLLVKGEI